MENETTPSGDEKLRKFLESVRNFVDDSDCCMALLAIIPDDKISKCRLATSINEAVIKSPHDLFSIFMTIYSSYCRGKGISAVEGIPIWIAALIAAYREAMGMDEAPEPQTH